MAEFPSHSKQWEDDSAHIFIASDVVAYLAKSSHNETYIDSGYTLHLSPRRDWFNNATYNNVLPQADDSIVGNRFKCTFCPEIDLCEGCRKAGVHNKHWMLKIKDPADVLGRECGMCDMSRYHGATSKIFVLSSH